MMVDPQNIVWDDLGFEAHETRSMFRAICNKDGSWQGGELIPYGAMSFYPSAGVLNYGQGVFEGTKAFRTAKGNVVTFRLNKNAERMAMSTKRLCIPEMDQAFFMDAVEQTVIDNIDFIPPYGKGSLYIRPIVWGTSPTLCVRPADEYTFIVFVSPVGPYFKGGVKPLHLIVSNKYHRAAPKGIGNAKAIGNYSASLFPLAEAKQQGFDEVIYLNAGNESMVEEVGSANLFILKDDTLRTPRLCGSILPGVTRDSVMRIAQKHFGVTVKETDVSLEDVLDADEVFCTGTAVVVTPVGKITLDGKDHLIQNGEIGELTNQLRRELLGIQREECDDPFGWLNVIGKS